ncbi:TOBE domain-containing protein, partial [Kineococcus glutinatus]|uniref:TOBE domain-containing protein n=1 Tax=Kineococcus glutinatus TaxID=1070872 RepID=UPI0031E7A3CE
VVVEAGRVVEEGPARDVLVRPRSAFAARAAGLNLVPGTAAPEGLRCADGSLLVGLRDGGCEPGEDAVAVFAPAAVAVHRGAPGGSPRNALAVVVAELEPRGPLVRVRAARAGHLPSGLAADVTAAAVADLDLAPGSAVRFVVKATEVAVHAAGRAS